NVVDVADREANVIENVIHLGSWNRIADCTFDLIREARRVFDPRSSLGPHMQDELAAIGIGKEVLSKERNQRESQQADDEKDRDKENSNGNKPSEQGRVGRADSLKETLKSFLKAGEWATRLCFIVPMCLQEIHRQRRHERTRENV